MRYVCNNEELAQNLKRARQHRGLSQYEVARKLNVDRSTYSYYENGRTSPSIFQIIEISKIFEVKVMYFLIEGTPEKDLYFGLSGNQKNMR